MAVARAELVSNLPVLSADPNANWLTGVVRANGDIVLLGFNTAFDLVSARSIDGGVNWVLSSPFQGLFPVFITELGGALYVVGTLDSNTVQGFTSTDGLTWTQRGPFTATGHSRVFSIAASSGVVVSATENNEWRIRATSVSAWNVSQQFPSNARPLSGVVYNGSSFITVHSQGTFGEPYSSTSVDGDVWVSSVIPVFPGGLGSPSIGRMRFVLGRIYAVISSNELWHSTDGLSWTKVNNAIAEDNSGNLLVGGFSSALYVFTATIVPGFWHAKVSPDGVSPAVGEMHNVSAAVTTSLIDVVTTDSDMFMLENLRLFKTVIDQPTALIDVSELFSGGTKEFVFTLESGPSLSFTLVGSGYADIFVRRDALPDPDFTGAYDFSAFGIPSQISIPSPAPGEYFVTVTGFGPGQFEATTLSASIDFFWTGFRNTAES